MKVSIIFCHFKTGKMSAYAVSQLLKYKGDHEIEILISDNNAGDGTIEYLKPFADHIKIFDFPKDRMQSHGAGYDFLIEKATHENIVAMESDSYPTKDNWLDFYEGLMNQGIEWAGSLLRLSGGSYVHPAGAFYKKSLWEEAKDYCENCQYSYFPNMANDKEFDCHLMVHNRILEEFLQTPGKFITLAKGYEGLTKEDMLAKRDYYKSITMPFHSGLGGKSETLQSFGQRTISSEVPHIILKNDLNFIWRIGHEPGQWMCYWLAAMGKNGMVVPTEIKWMRNRGFQQQEYTLMENGFKHLWGVSAYHGAEDKNMNDVIEFKKNQVEKLYNSLPSEFKI
jgi:glycosyltransferase involved in cell wall biosynthesis